MRVPAGVRVSTATMSPAPGTPGSGIEQQRSNPTEERRVGADPEGEVATATAVKPRILASVRKA